MNHRTNYRNLSIISALTLAAAIIVGFTGCASTSPPNAFDRQFAIITTNYVDKVVLKTNVVTVTLTNYAVETVYATNLNSQVIITTNVVPVYDHYYITNVVTATNVQPQLTYAPNATAQAVLTSTGGILGAVTPYGGLITTVLAGLLAAYFKSKSAQSDNTSVALAQIIETGREVLATTPQGVALESQWKKWMMEHQTDAGVIQNVALLLKQISPESAQVVAGEIVDLVNAQMPPSSPPAASAAKA